MTDDQPWTTSRLLNWTTDYLKGHDSESPRLDAEVLLAHCLNCERIALYTSFDSVPTPSQRALYRDLVGKRAQQVPVAYLVGHREFYSLDFHVTKDVLIPRPETEFVVISLLDLVKEYPPQPGKILQIADVGTGSGVLAVCAAKYLPRAHVTALDISAKALQIARKNVAQHGVSEQVTLVESDLFEGIDPAGQTFDFILSNPPYIGLQEMEVVAQDVRENEPHVALFAGPQGLDVITPLVSQATERVVSGGWFLMEISPHLESSVVDLFNQRKETWSVESTTKDLAGHARVIRARRI